MRRFILGTLCLVLAGCSNRQTGIEGRITLNGAPLESGLIVFQPVNGTASINAGGRIFNGQYKVPPGEGPSPGTFRVEIRSVRKTGKKLRARDIPGHPFGTDPNLMLDEEADVVPTEFNVRSTLLREIQAGLNNLDFELTSKAK